MLTSQEIYEFIEGYKRNHPPGQQRLGQYFSNVHIDRLQNEGKLIFRNTDPIDFVGEYYDPTTCKILRDPFWAKDEDAEKIIWEDYLLP